MGATTFQDVGEGRTAKEAFNRLVEDARYENGAGGYTGTIAEKHSFVTIVCPEGKDPFAYADQLIDDGDRRVDDKWGPAGCIRLGDGKYLFFGWASE
jgi:hypothetical protein